MLFLLLGGCYQYRTAAPDAVQPGQVVHLTLTAPGASALSSSIGPNATALNGRVLTRAGNDVTIALTQIARSSGPEQFLTDEPLTLPLSSVALLEVRGSDKPRTLLAVGGILAAVVAGQIFIDQSGVFSSKGTVSTGTK